MAPKSVASKSWRSALDRVIEAIKDELLLPHDPNVVVPEDEKFMDAGVYFQTKYPSGPAKDAFYAKLRDFFDSMGADVHSAIQACTVAPGAFCVVSLNSLEYGSWGWGGLLPPGRELEHPLAWFSCILAPVQGLPHSGPKFLPPGWISCLWFFLPGAGSPARRLKNSAKVRSRQCLWLAGKHRHLGGLGGPDTGGRPEKTFQKRQGLRPDLFECLGAARGRPHPRRHTPSPQHLPCKTRTVSLQPFGTRSSNF